MPKQVVFEEAIQETIGKALCKKIASAVITFYDSEGNPIYSEHFPEVRSGYTITVKAATPEDITIG